MEWRREEVEMDSKPAGFKDRRRPSGRHAEEKGVFRVHYPAGRTKPLNDAHAIFGKMTRFITIKANESIFYLVLTLACMDLLKSPFHVRRLTMRRRRYLFVALGMITFTSFSLEISRFLFTAVLTEVVVFFFSFFLFLTEARLMYSLIEGRIVKSFDLWKFLGDALQSDLQDLP
ncbi:hypothetical protein Taro_006292 [Colocasia esculenta]|uniref:Uncharacterized protein n=1 Tax=Colocasia esculenta TaxID=4460 RepID=A0A843TSA7_COLES|nr:hypothetical protein [Colocasia esculenta]